MLLVACTALFWIAGAQAVHDEGLFELDKNATNDLSVTPVGYLAANVTATETAIDVCRTASGDQFEPFPDTGDTILIRAERMTITDIASASFGGSCSGTKWTYTVTRGADGTSADAQTGGANNVGARVSLLVEAPTPGTDWDAVHASVTADANDTGDDDKCISLGLVECAFIADGIGPTTFIGGGTKDHLPVSGWRHTSGASPDKAEILNAYAAKGVAGDGDQIVYFGMDRYAVDGSTDIGFWFFKNPVVANPDGTFSGDQAVGDILILGTFTQGGATSDIRVFKWVGTGGNESGTIQGPIDSFGDCVPGVSGDDGCATVNNTTIEVPWDYTFKGESVGGWVPVGGFFEGGLNLTELGLAGCFSSFLAETRSSPEITAVLKDFALGAFETCESTLTTRPGNGVAGANNVQLTDSNANDVVDTSIGTGSVQVRDRATLNVTGIATWSGNLKFWLCGPIAPSTPPATCTTGGTQIGDAAGVPVDQGTAEPILSDAATVTSAGRYCWRAVFSSAVAGVPSGTDASLNECFEVLPVTPTITTDATDVVAGLGSISDTAILGGTARQPGSPIVQGPLGSLAGGNIVFRAYGPNDATCTGTPAFTSGEVAVSGDGTYGPASFTPTALGTYRWIASYSGNSPNTNATSGSCGDANETTEVVDANVSITPQTAVNAVGSQHVFTVSTTAFPAGTTATLASITPSISPAPGSYATTCGDSGLWGGSGNTRTCTVTIDSTSAGTFTLNASAVWSFGGLTGTVTGTVTRSTSGTSGPGGSGPATKRFVDASVTIGSSAVNQVGDAHTFTINVTPLASGATVSSLTITPSLSPAPVAPQTTSNTCDSPTLDSTTGVYSCTLTVNSPTVWMFTANVSTTVTFSSVGGAPDTASVTRSTSGNSGPGGSGPATKRFVDARITISEDATNKVNDPHTFTVLVEKNDGTGWSPAPGVAITSTETGVGSITGGSCGAPATGPTNAAGQCTVVVSSSTPGTSTVHASGTVTVGGVAIDVATDGYGAHDVGGVKTFVDARITIGTSGTNKVGDPHTFTVLVEKNDGTGWSPASGVAITSTETGVGSITGGTCGPSGPTNSSGQCTVVVSSAATGTSTVHASGTVTVGGVPIAVATNGYGQHDVSNGKTWVDARITIGTSGVNKVGDPHTFTVFVEKNDGTGWSPASGVTITSTETGVGSITGGTCGPTGPTGADGKCTVVVSSTATGTSTVHASGTVTVGGVPIAVATNGYGAHDVSGQKTWVDARITIGTTGTNKIGDPHTFMVLVEKNDGTGWSPASGVAITSTETGVGSITGGTCGPTGPTNADGKCTVIVNSTTPGSTTVHASGTVTVGGVAIAVATDGYGAHDVSGQKTWVDARITIGNSATNAVGDPHTFTVLVEKNDGTGWSPASGVTIDSTSTGVGSITGGTCGPTGPTNASGECTIIVNSHVAGIATVQASGTVTVGGVPIAVATNGYGAHDIGNQKTWANARISISPIGTNKVGDPHTFTVLVEKHNGTDWSPAAGVTITTTTNFGSITGGTCGPTGPTNAEGKCTVIVNSTATGTATVHASGTVSVGGVQIAVSTSGAGAHDVRNTKTWVDARITISQNATNQVNDPHTFTVFVEKNDGTGWSPAVGVTIGSTSSGVGSITGGSCGPTGPTSADGKCTVIVNSATPGSTTVHASGTVTVGGIAIAVATNGYGAHDVGGVKAFVDARITLGTTGTNKVGDPHTFTVFVEKNDGTGWSPASGVTITSTETGVGSITGGSCGPTGPTGADGKCTVVVNSTTPGTSTVHASGTVTVGGIAIAVATNGYGAHDIGNRKTWVDARITIGTSGVNQVGDPHTFTVSVEKNDGTGWSDAAGVTINSTSTGVGSIIGGTCGPTGPTNAAGDCTIIVNSNVAGTATINASGTVTVGGVSILVASNGYGAFNISNQKTWVSPPPPPPPPPPAPPTIDLSITKTDRPDPVNVGAELTYTLTIHNNGPSTATQVTVADSLPATVQYVSSSSTQGSCTGSGQIVRCTIGTMLPGATVVVTVVVKALEPGSILNTATVVGAEAETNTANNTASAPTLVVAPFKPPPAVCPTLTIQSRTLLVGRKGVVKAVVSLRGKGVAGVRVQVRGAGINKTGVSNSRGQVRITVRPARVGIVTIRITNQPGSCATRRIGVVGVFKPPPVTG